MKNQKKKKDELKAKNLVLENEKRDLLNKLNELKIENDKQKLNFEKEKKEIEEKLKKEFEEKLAKKTEELTNQINSLKTFDFNNLIKEQNELKNLLKQNNLSNIKNDLENQFNDKKNSSKI